MEVSESNLLPREGARGTSDLRSSGLDALDKCDI